MRRSRSEYKKGRMIPGVRASATERMVFLLQRRTQEEEEWGLKGR